MFQIAILMIMFKGLGASFKALDIEFHGLKRLDKMLILTFLICMRVMAIFIICFGIVVVHFFKVIWNFK